MHLWHRLFITDWIIYRFVFYAISAIFYPFSAEICGVKHDIGTINQYFRPLWFWKIIEGRIRVCCTEHRNNWDLNNFCDWIQWKELLNSIFVHRTATCAVPAAAVAQLVSAFALRKVRRSNPRRNSNKSLKLVVTAPLFNALQQVWVSGVLGNSHYKRMSRVWQRNLNCFFFFNQLNSLYQF